MNATKAKQQLQRMIDIFDAFRWTGELLSAVEDGENRLEEIDREVAKQREVFQELGKQKATLEKSIASSHDELKDRRAKVQAEIDEINQALVAAHNDRDKTRAEFKNMENQKLRVLHDIETAKAEAQKQLEAMKAEIANLKKKILAA